MIKRTIITYILIFYTSTVLAIESNEKKYINKIIEQYILNNPEIIIKSLEQYSRNKEKLSKELSDSIISSYYEKKIYKNYPSVGSEKEEIILTEFIDYNCGYCKKTLKTILDLMKDVKNIKIVFVDYPILSETSELAARAALAANNQKSYFEYHSKLLEHNKPLTEDYLLSTAKLLKLNLKIFKKDMHSNKIKKKIQENIQLAQSLQIRGTPTFILGKNILPGAYEYKKLKEMILDNKL